jgi:hypothetical protein
MSRPVIALAALSFAALLCGPALAKHRASQTAQAAQTDTQATSSDQPAAGVPANADLTGQMIYTSTGNTVGRVASMSKDAQGQRTAVIGAEKRLGIGATKVLLPISQLQPRENGGGYFTNLTLSQVRDLPKAP